MSKPRISSRIAAIAESATLAVDAKAKALKAAGRPVIGFGAGEPDFPTPDYIVEAAAAATKVVANHRYSPTPGLPELRQAIVNKTKRDSNYEISVDQVLVTNGGKQAVYQAFASIINPGDEVILPSPFWTTYPECIKLAGGKTVEVFADESQDYLVSIEQLEAARSENTKALLFCSPSNPTGAVYSNEQVKAIGQWAAKHGIWIISDEIYELINFVGKTYSIGACEGMLDRTITVNGVSKAFAMTGWRLGYIGAPLWVAQACNKMQGQITSGTNCIAQRACISALESPVSKIKYMVDEFKLRRELIINLLKDIKGFNSAIQRIGKSLKVEVEL